MKKNKYFIITIDTEADNQWDFYAPLSTKNTNFLPRFQELCEKYSFIPVWLTDYEMASDDNFVTYFKQKQDKGLCEIGMHLHGWSSPPNYPLVKKYEERPFIYEYPNEIIEKKIENLTSLLIKKFDKIPISHRAGRWAFNRDYAKLLKKYNYLIDCSVTPNINWSNTLGMTGQKGPDFSNVANKVYDYDHTGLIEIPVTIRKIHYFNFNKIIVTKGVRRFLGSFKAEFINMIKGVNQWLRPTKDLSLRGLKKLVKQSYNGNENYLMFMIHSSELMPNGSPNFKDEESIEKLYNLIEKLFSYIKKFGYSGISFRDYYKNLK